MSFANKHVVITGGSSGLGLGLAAALIERGARLTLVARNREKLVSAAASLQSQHQGSAVAICDADVSDPAAARSAMESIVATGGGIDVLVNNAGSLREGYFEQLADEDFRDVMNINYFGALYTTRAALPYLKQSRGSVINIASMAGLLGAFGYTAYCASKHALVGLTSCLRYEMEPLGVQVQLVCPGEFDSPMVDALDASRTPENRAHTLTIRKESLDSIVAQTVAGMERGDYLIIPSRPARWIARLARFAPSVVVATGRKAIAKANR